MITFSLGEMTYNDAALRPQLIVKGLPTSAGHFPDDRVLASLEWRAEIDPEAATLHGLTIADARLLRALFGSPYRGLLPEVEFSWPGDKRALAILASAEWIDADDAHIHGETIAERRASLAEILELLGSCRQRLISELVPQAPAELRAELEQALRSAILG